MASPRVCCADREAAVAVAGKTRVERVEKTAGDGACRDSILRIFCAQLSVSGRRGTARWRLRSISLDLMVMEDRGNADWLFCVLELLRAAIASRCAEWLQP